MPTKLDGEAIRQLVEFYRKFNGIHPATQEALRSVGLTPSGGTAPTVLAASSSLEEALKKANADLAVSPGQAGAITPAPSASPAPFSLVVSPKTEGSIRPQIILILKNGQRAEGIILSEDAKGLWLRVAERSEVYFSQAEILRREIPRK